MTTHDFIQIAQYSAPTIVRMSTPLLKEVAAHILHFWSHRGAHKVLHVAEHKSHFAHRLLKRFPYAVDVIVIAVMMVFSTLTEGREHASE
jgi:hypothetical protein